ncbi:hypothetical protein [Thiolapillus sp.]
MKKLNLVLGMMLAGATGMAAADSLYIAADGNVEVGKLEVKQPAGTHAAFKFTVGANYWEIKQNADTGRLTFFYPGGGATTASFKFAPQAQENLFRVGVLAGDTVDINGKLVVNNVQIADYVFAEGYDLPTIEEQAAFMFQNHHLPAVQKGDKDMKANIDVMANQMAMLEELEKAHIYITQLNDTIKEMKSELAEIKAASK